MSKSKKKKKTNKAPAAVEETGLSLIPEQISIPWGVAFTVSIAGLKRRFFRSIITMLGVVLGIAMLSYMCITDNITRALVGLHNDTLNVMLQKAGVDIFASGGMNSMMILLISLSLVTCLVGIINSMLMSVTERIREIGTIKCLGALDSFIVRTYFIESSLQGVVGTLTGMLIGFVVAVGIAYLNYGGYVNAAFPGGTIMRSLLISLFVGTLISVSASILPAYWAAKKEPVDAMRVEE